MEDFDALGLSEGKKSEPSSKPEQVKEPDSKGGDYAGPPGDKKPGDSGGDVDLQGDEAAGHYTYVPVRSDTKSQGVAKAESSENGKMVPSFMIPTEEEVQQNAEQLAEQAEKDQLKRAWEVINAYFSEDEDGLNEAGLRGVINAMGHALNVAVEDIALLSNENVRLTEAVNDLNRLLREEEEEEEEEGEEKRSKPAWMKPKSKEDDEDEDEDEDEGEAKSRFESRRGGNLMEDASLNSILDEVASLGGSPRKQAVSAQARLIEGFEGAAASAADLVERIISVMRDDEGLSEDEDLEFEEGDQRAEVARFFYSIAEDAQNYLTRLADGDVAFRVAEEDLKRLHNDIEKGIEAMHHIP